MKCSDHKYFDSSTTSSTHSHHQFINEFDQSKIIKERKND